MKVCIIECNHEPINLSPQRLDVNGTKAVKRILDQLQQDQGHYYDAVLYERAQHTGMMGED